MKNAKRSLALLLCALMTSTFVLASCGSSSGKGGETVSQSTDAVTTEAAETELSADDERLLVSDDLPDRDYEGYAFRIYYYSETDGGLTLVPEEMTGDVVNDATYQRNVTVEDRFNTTITTIFSGKDDWSAHASAVKKIVLAGEDAFDVSFDHIIGGPNNSLEGLYVNFYDIPYLDFEKPWWQKAQIRELTVLGQMYLVSNDFCTQGISSCKVIYCNKQRLADYNIESPYGDVFDGVWTFDELIGLTKDVYEDVNGDGQRDNGDFYGYISHGSQNGFLTSFEIPILSKDDENGITITVDNPKTYEFFEKLTQWYYHSDGCNIINGTDPDSGLSETDWQAALFADGRSLFAFSLIKHAASTFRNSDIEYGILPFPKWDENQEDYITFSSGLLISVPITATDLERTGIIYEALSAEGYKQLIPAYFETALKEKFTFDNESAQMLDLINTSRAISFSYAYDNWEGFGHMTYKVSKEKDGNFASFYASRISSAEKRLNKIVDFFESHKA